MYRPVLSAFLAIAMLFPVLAARGAVPETQTPPAEGAAAPNFSLKTLGGQTVELAALTSERPVVLLVLRGWPGYQCPLCTKQVHEFVAQAAAFKARGAQVLMVYPGPAEQLVAHAQEFIADKAWPAEFLFVIDPDYTFTNAYALRWSAPKETAYPSAFVIDRGGRIRFAKVSKTHGGRVSVEQALAALP
jgi:peroxiredoxin